MVFLLVAIWSHLTKEIALLNFDTSYVALCDDAPRPDLQVPVITSRQRTMDRHAICITHR
ncbi:MAG: hypothetical protein DME07_24255 [Candidatus Rokuibacteriota bacterium]|nr:MAG: hypothetical protein DME07_24255 [Candidatus Rokubacteria bacterium]PYN52599.1 MAG: hypothetical protein DMD94_21760 [Candidatus Rokubacteria bacterium]